MSEHLNPYVVSPDQSESLNQSSFNSTNDYIDYLEGRVRGLEDAIKNLVLLLSGEETNFQPLEYNTVSSTKMKAGLLDGNDDLFDLESALLKLDTPQQILLSSVEVSLEECWQASDRLSLRD